MATIDSKTGVITQDAQAGTIDRTLVATAKVSIDREGATGSATAQAYQEGQVSVVTLITDGEEVEWRYASIEGSGTYEAAFHEGVTRYDYYGVTSFKTDTNNGTTIRNSIVEHIKEIHISGKLDTLVLKGAAPEVLDLGGLDTSGMESMELMFCGVTFPDPDVDLANFDTSKVTTARWMFYGSNVRSVAGLSGLGACTTFYGMFRECEALTSLDCSGWDTSRVTTAEYMFDGCEALTTVTGLSGLGACKTMQAMFQNCLSATVSTFAALSNLDTSSVTNMSSMFRDCSTASGAAFAPLGQWDVSKVTDMSYMFYGCSRASATAFMGLTSWDVPAVTTMAHMFQDCSRLENLDLSGWDPKALTNTSYMFSGCSSLTFVSGLASWDMSKVTTIAYMFQDCSSGSFQDLSFTSGWDVGSVTSIAGAFSGCSNLESVSGLSKWNVSKVTNMSYTFQGCAKLTSDAMYVLRYNPDDPDSRWGTSKVMVMDYTFSGCAALADLDFMSGWDTSALTSMAGTFQGCEALADISALKKWDVTGVTGMAYLFDGDALLTDTMLDDCIGAWRPEKLQTVQYMLEGLSGIKNIDFLVNWDMTHLTNIAGLVQGCTALEDVSPMSDWDVSSVTNMAMLFAYCTSLPSISAVSGWRPTVVTNMAGIAFACYSLESVTPITGWTTNTAKLTAIDGIFYGLQAAEYDLSNLDISGINSPTCLFLDANLTHLKVGTLGTRAVNVTEEELKGTYGMLYGCSSLTSLDGDIGTIGAGYKSSTLTYYGTVDLSGAPLDHDTAMKFINALEQAESADYNTLYLHADTYAALTADEIAVGTAKKWGVQAG